MTTITGTVRQRAILFFRDNAGFSVPPGRLVCAKRLAEAEAAASGYGCTFEWEQDDQGSDTYGDHAYWCDQEAKGVDHAHEVLYCVMRDQAGEVVGSLGGVIDPTQDYMRVVEAELASEWWAGVEPDDETLSAWADEIDARLEQRMEER